MTGRTIATIDADFGSSDRNGSRSLDPDADRAAFRDFEPDRPAVLEREDDRFAFLASQYQHG